jgi:hypothetical protein
LFSVLAIIAKICNLVGSATAFNRLDTSSAFERAIGSLPGAGAQALRSKSGKVTCCLPSS